jgi:hypothetical protein
MTAKKVTSTLAQEVNRIYRRQIAIDRKLDVILEQLPELASAAFVQNAFGAVSHNAKLHEHQAATIKTLADHVARLTREKETLMKMVGLQDIERFQKQWKEANAYMGNPLPHTDGL